ncbi:MAG: 50S ribosomal protein L20 [Bdellovibrionales bacterium]|nr:50S ribosomal protein L20 [Bdellovibrionales bacterium]
MRVKGGVKGRRRHNKIMKRTEGFRNAGGRCYRHAVEKHDRAFVYAYRDRKVKKREFRNLWTIRINAAARELGTTYSRLIGALNKSKLELNRKVLADMAVNNPLGFAALVKELGLKAQA